MPVKKTKKRTTKRSTKSKKQEHRRLPRPLVIMIAGLSVLIIFQAPSLVQRAKFHVSEAFSFTQKQPTSIQLYTMGPDELYIASLNIHAPLVFIQAKSEVAFQRALQDGVVHYPETAGIGKPGNAYFFGHSSDLPWAGGNYKTVFALLPEIKPGDVIIATDKKNHPYRYQTYETLVVDPTDTSVLDQFNNEDEILSLQTSYPVGTALQRFVVRARLVEGPSAISPRE